MSIEVKRNEIDQIDAELLRLINQRAKVACELFHLKRIAGTPICDPERELQVVKRAQQFNSGPLDELAVARIFRTVIEESRHLEEKLATEKETA